MSLVDFSDFKPSLTLYELSKNLKDFIKLYQISKFPKVLMLSGEKGVGKFTLIYHFLAYHFDKKNYNLDKYQINNNSFFYNNFLNNVFPNIIYIKGSNFKNSKVEDIRKLKSTILKTSISDNTRFIIFDDIELLNTNSLNALLKIIEEPSSKNNFILINNKRKKIIETIHSRSLEFKIILSNTRRLSIINSLIKKNDLETIKIDFKNSGISPGNFLRFNNICASYTIDINDDYLRNIILLINLYKKEKNPDIIDMSLYLTNNYFYNLSQIKATNLDKALEDKSFIIKNINYFISFNINQNSLISAISNRFKNE